MPETVKAIVENSVGYIWFFLMALWGGTASYISRIKKTGCGFSTAELIGEWFISGFAGVVTAHVCLSVEMDFYKTAALVGIAGHMGGRGLFIVESLVKNRLFKMFGNVSDKSKD